MVVIKAKEYKEPLYNDSLVRPCSQYILETTCYIIYIRLKVVASVTARTKSHSIEVSSKKVKSHDYREMLFVSFPRATGAFTGDRQCIRDSNSDAPARKWPNLISLQLLFRKI